MPTPRDSYDAFLDAVCELVAEADQRFGCKGSVGIGIPGMPETEDGTLYAANVPAASGKPLRADLSARLDRDVRLDNDANCFALSEAWDDEFTQYPLVMGLILGTGVGGGLIFNGKPITGKSYITGEFGHMRLPVDALTMMGLISRYAAAAVVSMAALKIICLVAVLRGCINTIIINRCRLPKLLRFMIKAMSRQGRTLSVIWIY